MCFAVRFKRLMAYVSRGCFVRNRLNLAAREYAKRPTSDVVSTRLLELENLVVDLTNKCTDITLHSAVNDPFKITSKPPSKQEEDVENDDDKDDVQNITTAVSREELIQSMSWEELSVAAHVLAKNTYRPQTWSPEKIQSGALFPQFIATEDNDKSTLDDGAYTQLLFTPYFTHYQAIRQELVESGRRLHLKRLELSKKMPHLQIDILATLSPGEWVTDFLFVFDRAKRVGASGYPSPREMNDVFFTTNIVNIIDHGTSGSHAVSLKNYAADIGYHFVRFASLYTTIKFNPVSNLNMSPAVYTDMELLVHFAMRTAQRDVRYEDFLLQPSSYLTGTKYMIFVPAIKRAAKEIMDSFRNGLFFKARSRYGLDLQRRTLSSSGVWKKEPAPVPNEIMVGLVMDILENVTLYERRREMAVLSGYKNLDVRDSRLESPIGRLLNFDERAVAEFKCLYRELDSSCPESVNAQLSERVASLGCVQHVYAMLVSAASTLYANWNPHDQKLGVSTVIDKCIHAEDTIKYASSAEAYPGLLFYTMLASGSRPEDFLAIPRETALEEELPGVSSPGFFEDRPDRKSFFDTFGCYAFRMKAISKSKLDNALPVDVNDTTEGIRWMTDESIHMIRSSAGKQLWESKAAYISLLGFFAHPNNRTLWLNNPDVLDYFKDTRRKRGHYKPLTKFERTTDDFRAFFALPVMYIARMDCVDVARPHKAHPTAGGGSRLGDILKQITTNLDEAGGEQVRPEDDVSRLLV